MRGALVRFTQMQHQMTSDLDRRWNIHFVPVSITLKVPKTNERVHPARVGLSES